VTVTELMVAGLASCTVSVAVGLVAIHGVAVLPSTAATGSLPGTLELDVTVWQRARSPVDCRSGRRVGMVAGCPGATVIDPEGVCTGSADPELRVTCVL
jgi:hypothetical protein